MIYSRYIVCPVCRCVTRVNADEEELCAYCGVNIQEGKEASESQWRKYWIGVVMQPYSLNTVKKTKQLSLDGTNPSPAPARADAAMAFRVEW